MPSTAAGSVSLRSVSTRSEVASSWGVVDGMTARTAVSPASLTIGAPTAATPSSAETASWMPVRTAVSPASSSSTTTLIVALKPGP